MVDPVESQFAIWLTPAPSDRRWLSKIIQDYAADYDSPAFEPHVTVYGGICTVQDDLSTTLTEFANSSAPLSLEVTGLGYTASFFRTGFISFTPHPDLTALSEKIGEQLQSPYRLEPHLSLIYKDLTLDQKRLAMLRIILSVQTITFDTLKVVKPSDQNWFNIPSWREQSRFSLKG